MVAEDTKKALLEKQDLLEVWTRCMAQELKLKG